MSRFEAPPGIVANGLVLNLDAGDPDSYTRSQPPYVEVLVVAGGGGAGGHGGGGGAGGLIYNSAYQITNASAITVTVGGGGAGTTGPANGANGSNSVFGSLTAIGGGGGAYANPGSNGGSGGGGGYNGSAGGLGTAGQGNDGGKGDGGTNSPGGGGGGAGQVGGNNVGTTSGKGGDGLAFSISGTSTYYAGGGGGNGYPSSFPGAGGLGGGATGGSSNSGTANTGGGGGGGNGSGGSGIVIVRYPGLPAATGGTIAYLNGYTIHTFTTSGTFTPNLWNDVSGNNNSGSLVNGVGFNSYQNGGYLTFDGTDDVVNVVGNFGTYANYTICYWAVRDAENRMPVASRINAPFYWYGDNSWAYTHGGVGGELYYSKNVSIPLGSWGHLCVVYNGSNVSIYRQGIYQDQQATTGTANWSQGLKIGNWDAGGGYAWLGDIATVQFYTRALSSTEITQNYNAQKARFGL